MDDYPFAITSEAGAPEEYKGSVGCNDFEGEVTEEAIVSGNALPLVVEIY